MKGYMTVRRSGQGGKSVRARHPQTSAPGERMSRKGWPDTLWSFLSSCTHAADAATGSEVSRGYLRLHGLGGNPF